MHFFRRNILTKGVLGLLFVAAPHTASAFIDITEIMYDLPGTDTGREWIEIHNSGSASVDATTLRFFEANVNHSLSEYQGGAILSPGGYAVIADNPIKFLEDWPGYGGILFDSAFSLNNTGEFLAIRNADGETMSEVTYSGEWGAAGDGHSLQKSGNSFVQASPTPGASYANTSTSNTAVQSTVTQTQVVASTNTASATPSTNTSSTNSSSNITIPPLVVSAGKDVLTASGNPVIFRAEINPEYQKGRHALAFEWALGDGSILYGQTITHQYTYPGEYVVVVTAHGEDKKAVSRISVRVVDPQFTIKTVPSGGVEISNNTSYEIDLYKWKLVSGDTIFTFPLHTIIKSNTKIIIAPHTSGFAGVHKAMALVDPLGRTIATTVEAPLPIKSKKVSRATPLNQSVSATPALSSPEGVETTNLSQGSVLGETSETLDMPNEPIRFEVQKQEGLLKRVLSFLGGLFD